MINRIFPAILLIGFSIVLVAQTNDQVIVENYQKFNRNEAVRCILIDKKNFKWLGTDRGLYKMASMELAPELVAKDSVRGLAEDKKENLWYGNHVDLLNNITNPQSIFLGKNQINISCMVYYNGDIWVGSDKGLFRVSDDQNKVLNQYTPDNSKLKSAQINMLYVDSENKLWVGTDAGVVIIDRKDWDAYEKDHKITGAINTSEGVWLLAETKMWLIYKEDGRDRWQDAAVKRGLSKGPVRALAADSKGRVYIASEILVQFDPYSDKSLQIDEDYGFVSSQNLSLACDKNDDLWVGTADKGLFRIDFIDGNYEKLSAIAYAKGENKCASDHNAQILVIAKGGKTPYSYKWNNDRFSGSKIDSISAGDYSVTVTDAEGEEFVTSVQVNAPTAVEIELSSVTPVTEINKKDGKASIKIKGGVAPYRILWDNGRTLENVGNLGAGKRSVRVADHNNCYVSMDIMISQPKVIPELDRKKITIGQTLQINELYFAANSSEITDESSTVLNEIYEFLVANNDVQIEIGGHTNSVPSDEFCDKLSSDRAKNVADYLYSKGIPKDQITDKGYGKRLPIASNETLAGRQKKQRVEIKIITFKQG